MSVCHVSVMKVYGVGVLRLLKQSLYIYMLQMNIVTSYGPGMDPCMAYINICYIQQYVIPREDLSTYESRMEFD